MSLAAKDRRNRGDTNIQAFFAEMPARFPHTAKPCRGFPAMECIPRRLVVNIAKTLIIEIQIKFQHIYCFLIVDVGFNQIIRQNTAASLII
ncbi:hypothetical protein D3C77_594090 [compost metagenome]